MLCEVCKQNPATVHVTELDHSACAADGNGSAKKPVRREQHLCEQCAQDAKLPHNPAKNVVEIWKLLQAASVQRARRDTATACPECGMTVLEFRQRGRLGCPKDYEVFGPQLADLLERIHGAAQHKGRGPSTDEGAAERMRRVSELQQQLDLAIKKEAYEDAARLRDELRSLRAP
jgi:protein arginine kinase activator